MKMKLLVDEITRDGMTVGGMTVGGMTVGGMTVGGMTVGGMTVDKMTVDEKQSTSRWPFAFVFDERDEKPIFNLKNVIKNI
jgi:hypothetical protein